MHPLLKKYFTFIQRFIPTETKSVASVGLDLGAHDCKLVEIQKTEEGFEVLNWAVEPVEGGKVQETVGKTLKQLSGPCEALYTAISGKGTLIRYIDMPRMNIKDLKNSFDIEADKYFPFASDQIYTDCYILDPEGKGKQMSVMAAAAKKELISERMTLLNELKVQPDFIGINPIALVNALNNLGYGEEQPMDKAVALLDMGDSISSLTITLNKTPWFTRDIFVGGQELTKRISNALGVTPQEAEKLKDQPGDRLDDVLVACESAVMNVVQELKLSFDYFSSEKGVEIGQLLITGGASMLKGLDELFEKNLEVNVKSWNPFDSLKLAEGIDKEEFNKYTLKLGVALGLALYDYD